MGVKLGLWKKKNGKEWTECKKCGNFKGANV
jgi:hypothetical protein